MSSHRVQPYYVDIFDYYSQFVSRKLRSRHGDVFDMMERTMVKQDKEQDKGIFMNKFMKAIEVL